MYAIPLGVSEDCLLDRWDYPSNNDLLRSMLINEGVSESLQAYYELVHGDDLSACGELLLHRKRLLELLPTKRILTERLGMIRLDQFPLGNIFTTGLPREDADRYYSS